MSNLVIVHIKIFLLNSKDTRIQCHIPRWLAIIRSVGEFGITIIHISGGHLRIYISNFGADCHHPLR